MLNALIWPFTPSNAQLLHFLALLRLKWLSAVFALLSLKFAILGTNFLFWPFWRPSAQLFSDWTKRPIYRSFLLASLLIARFWLLGGDRRRLARLKVDFGLICLLILEFYLCSQKLAFQIDFSMILVFLNFLLWFLQLYLPHLVFILPTVWFSSPFL